MSGVKFAMGESFNLRVLSNAQDTAEEPEVSWHSPTKFAAATASRNKFELASKTDTINAM